MFKWITKILFLIYFVSLCCPSLVWAQVISNEGTEFWGVFPTHEPDFDTSFHPLLANASLFITSNQFSSGKVTVGSFSKNFTVNAGAVTEIQIPRNSAYINDTESGNVLSNRAIHVLVDPGMPKIVVYEHIFAGQRSAATLLLPHEALSKQYVSINYQESGADGRNFIVIAATEPNTKVHIKKGLTELVPGGITLNKVNDVYEYLSNSDLSGVSVSVDTLVSGCNRFAMYSGSSGVRISSPGCEAQSLDPLFQQCYPVESWGFDYGFIPFSMKSPDVADSVRTAGQYIRILAKDAGTSVKINGQIVANLNAGEFYTSPQPLRQPAYIAANHAVCVAQYALSQTCSTLQPAPDNNGKSYSDPDMVILNPIEYNIKDITLYSSTRENITEQYINVLIKTAAASSFKINGHAPSAPFKIFTNLSGYSFLQLNINKDSTNTYQLSANDGFNAIAYGFGPVESYSYSAGTNLSADQAFDVIQRSTDRKIDSACVNDDFFFRLTLPYISPQITWKMDDLENPVTQPNPAYDTLTTNGKTIYAYKFPKTNAYVHAGLHQIKITANYAASTGGCNTGQQEIDETFLTIGLPTIKLIAQPEVCNNIIDFKCKNIDTVFKVTSWNWNFGDHKCPPTLNTSSLINPIHAYSTTGTYIVSLTITSSAGCEVTVMDTVHISPNIVPDFTTSNPACVKQPVTFTDSSVSTNFVTATWQWYFGDGDSIQTTSPAPVTHLFRQPGVYKAHLVLISDKGCLSDTVTKQINVETLPLPGFTAPSACITDQFAQFINKSVRPEGDNQSLSYLWHFGDAYATPANPDTSTEENPRHKYSVAQSYTASLTVHTANGCDTTISKTFIINGASPKADFEILNSARACTGQPIMLLDKSHVVDFGNITKLEWYFDTNDLDNRMVIDSLHPDHIYSYTYHIPPSVTDSINYTIKLRAYCGTVCVDSVMKTVSVFPATQLEFPALSNICISAPPLQITAARETTGVKGTGRYSGSGITTDGVFDPAAAGLGPHILTYTFYSEGGCQDVVSQSITVVSTPGVAPLSPLFVSEGQSIVLKPNYAGNNLTYHWTPSTGLDQDSIPFPKLTATNNIIYNVAISNGLCQSSGQVQIIVLEKPDNTFTPNGDGINDFWSIKGLDGNANVTVQIFNRYGTLVFYSNGYPVPWDGRYKGNPVPVGTYYYIISPKGWKNPITGSVTVIR